MPQILKEELSSPPKGRCVPAYFRAIGYRNAVGQPDAIARAEAIATLFSVPKPHIYENDLIVGSIRSLFVQVDDETLQRANEIVSAFPERGFWTNYDHFAPDYRRILSGGIPGLYAQIAASKAVHQDDPEALIFLSSMQIALDGFVRMIRAYAEGAQAQNRLEIAQICRKIADSAPETFRQALQLVWFCHIAFRLEGRYAMALGRLDQYLYPFYQNDLAAGRIEREEATALFANAFIKLYENRVFFGSDDVVNIAIGGRDREGNCMVNELSYAVLEAVRRCNIPGPNLSARICASTPDAFLDACLKVIGTGLGYPALMNDEVNIPALSRMGYEEDDVIDYSMVGCIENFITGAQPPWTDGRFDTPRFFEYIFNRGKGICHPSEGIDVGEVDEIASMSDFLHRIELQIERGVKAYVEAFNAVSGGLDPKTNTSPFLSLFCRDCIGRAKDINDGGARYPSAHGAALMGVGTVADSLAAIEKTVFVDRITTLSEIERAIKADFVGYEDLQKALLAAPKYGNNDDFVDKYAVWFLDFQVGEFDRYRTPDGGRFYVAMAANTANIYAGLSLAATPDGRKAGQPLSDAASPTYGRDTRGVTALIHSVTKPDYKKVACGTVINQKFSPALFADGKREKLLTLVKTYLGKGGQEMQINATSRATLLDAMAHPENYGSLVVRVSGFSAYYVTLDRVVQLDILERTQHE